MQKLNIFLIIRMQLQLILKITFRTLCAASARPAVCCTILCATQQQNILLCANTVHIEPNIKHLKKLHRKDRDVHGHVLPAVISANGDMHWYWRGFKHRECSLHNILPAAIFADASQEYWRYSKKKLYFFSCVQ